MLESDTTRIEKAIQSLAQEVSSLRSYFENKDVEKRQFREAIRQSNYDSYMASWNSLRTRNWVVFEGGHNARNA